jgi:hypothetical protein
MGASQALKPKYKTSHHVMDTPGTSIHILCIRLFMMEAVLLCLIPPIIGVRGPHHPRGVPQDRPNHDHHRHYVPQRQDAGNMGEPSPKLTQDKQLLHDTE